MPRFLDTLTGNFVWMDNPHGVVYAILSHTWRSLENGGEQSYQDVRRLQDEMEATDSPAFNHSPAGPDTATGVHGPTIFSHAKLSDKIKGVCEVARKAGYRLIWNDACCIDKSSSAELTEAINSMFELYRLADVCYTFLEDVPDGDIPSDISSRFRSSRWHTRGWTLQELIAPKRMVFLTKTWHILGTKLGLASILEERTGVDFSILTGRVTLAADSISTARRMFWASGRQTTRVEDRAYSLMGLFGVHMPTIYGEGTNAFLRLQEEIIRTVPDQSIFAWGSYRTLPALHQGSSVIHSSPKYGHGLLANSPSDFCDSGDVHPWTSLRAFFEGVQIVLLCIDLKKVPIVLWELTDNPLESPSDFSTAAPLCKGCMQLGHAHLLALLQCEDKDGFLIALPLCRPQWKGGAPTNAGGLAIVTHLECNNFDHDDVATQPVRTVRLSHETLANGIRDRSQGPERIEVSILRHLLNTTPPERNTHLYDGDAVALCTRLREQLWETNPVSVDFQIAPRSQEELATLGLSLSPLRCSRTGNKIDLSTSLTPDLEHHIWHGRRRQSVQLELSLVGSLMAPAGSDPTWVGTMATFSAASTVCNISGISKRNRGPGISEDGNLQVGLGPRRPPPSDGLAEASDLPVAKVYLRCDLSYGRSLTDRILADAEFIVFWRCTDEDSNSVVPDQDSLDCRLLRFTLECSSDRTDAGDYRNL